MVPPRLTTRGAVHRGARGFSRANQKTLVAMLRNPAAAHRAEIAVPPASHSHQNEGDSDDEDTGGQPNGEVHDSSPGCVRESGSALYARRFAFCGNVRQKIGWSQLDNSPRGRRFSKRDRSESLE